MPENPLSNAHVVVPSAPSDEPEDNPYRAADAVVPGADVLPPAAIAEDAWDEGHAAGEAAATARIVSLVRKEGERKRTKDGEQIKLVALGFRQAADLIERTAKGENT